MNPRYGKIALVLVLTIIAGGLLVAFLGYSSTSAGTTTTTYSGGASIPITSNGYSGTAESSTTATTATMTSAAQT